MQLSATLAIAFVYSY